MIKGQERRRDRAACPPEGFASKFNVLNSSAHRSLLALVLKAELEARIAALGQKGSWPAIIGDPDALTETEVEQDGRRFI